MNRKLQVFVSSTYTDMLEERQGAIEAILECGHIPAGMELFSADNKKQFEVIKKWIRSSDVFLLILGGRYGSIETSSGKSYIQKEYEFAKQIGKKPIAIILSDEGIARKIAKGDYSITDKEYLSSEYTTFKQKITDSKLCDFFDDVTSLKNCIYKVLKNCESNSNLVGWVKANTPGITFSYPYIIERQDFAIKYLDLHNIEYFKTFKIRMLVDGMQYYTDRYSWNAGGVVTKTTLISKQEIVDEFADGAFTAYTIRLEEPSQKDKIYIISVHFTITNCNYIEHQYLGLTNSFPVQNLKLRVEIPDGLSLSECKYNIYEHSVDRVPSISKKIQTKNKAIEKEFSGLVIGKRYNIEWRVKQK